ncbi:MAG: hypothetical protein FD171_994 [Actinobacteria bacterium]|nr:MAG: hypothetical protein FD171_994 [Actinomycetota bacterium]
MSLFIAAVPAAAFGAVSLTHERVWGTNGWGNGQFNFPPDVATDKFGTVYVAGGENGDDRVQVFGANGVFVDSVGATNVASGSRVSPRTVATDRWGNVYVGEKGSAAVNANVRLYGRLLNFDYGTFQESVPTVIGGPTNIAVALDETVYVSDNGTEIQRWRNRSYVDEFPLLGRSSMGLGVTQDGDVLTTTDISWGIINSVITYDGDGNYLNDWGGYGTAAGQFDRPYDVGADPLGNVYTIEFSGNRGQVFTPGGAHLATFGSSGVAANQFGNPYGIAVGLDRTVYVADSGQNRISKWNVTVATESTQVAGDSRYTTAVEASKRAYPNGATTVVVATGETFPDALGGAALAGVARGPLLLTPKNTLPLAVANEIIRLKATRVYVLGGEGAVSADVYHALNDLMILAPPIRLPGGDRFETANLIATEVIRLKNLDGGYDGTAFVATGMDFPDALAASPIAAANGWPIYLTRPVGLPASVKTAMTTNGSNHGYILGGTGAVSGPVATVLNTAPFIGFTRYGGGSRYETAAKIATAGFSGMGMLWSRPALAVGTDFPDALAGGVLQGSDCSLLLLTPKASLDPYAAAALTANKDSIYEIRFLGGTGAIGTAPRNAAKALLW